MNPSASVQRRKYTVSRTIRIEARSRMVRPVLEWFAPVREWVEPFENGLTFSYGKYIIRIRVRVFMLGAPVCEFPNGSTHSRTGLIPTRVKQYTPWLRVRARTRTCVGYEYGNLSRAHNACVLIA